MGNKMLKMSCLGYSKDLIDEPISHQTPLPNSISSSLCKGSISKLAAANHTRPLHQSSTSQPDFAITKSSQSSSLSTTEPPDVDVSSTSSSSSYKALTPSPPRQSIKVLFLDVDGVLNTNSTIWDERNKGLEDRHLAYLRLIVERSRCKIVLSTAWRLHHAYKDMLLHELQMRGGIDVRDAVIGCTPYLPNCYRATEISMFIHRYNSNLNNKYYISNFVVIDDLPLNTYPRSLFLDGHFVHTDKAVGLSILNVVDCIQILNSLQFVPYQKQRKC